MSELCSAPHPERPSIVCDKPVPCWVYHANAPAQATWEGTPLPPSPTPSKGGSSRKGHLAMIAKRAQ